MWLSIFHAVGQVGPIAGGTVAGIVIVLLIIALVVFGGILIYKKTQVIGSKTLHSTDPPIVNEKVQLQDQVVTYTATELLYTSVPMESSSPIPSEEPQTGVDRHYNNRASQYCDPVDLKPDLESGEVEL